MIVCWKLTSFKADRGIFLSQHIKAMVASTIWTRNTHGNAFPHSTQPSLQYLHNIFLTCISSFMAKSISRETLGIWTDPRWQIAWFPSLWGSALQSFLCLASVTGRKIIFPCFPGNTVIPSLVCMRTNTESQLNFLISTSGRVESVCVEQTSLVLSKHLMLWWSPELRATPTSWPSYPHQLHDPIKISYLFSPQYSVKIRKISLKNQNVDYSLLKHWCKCGDQKW